MSPEREALCVSARQVVADYIARRILRQSEAVLTYDADDEPIEGKNAL